MSALHAFVISWRGQADAAAHIAQELAPHVERLTVIHSDDTGAPLPFGWVRTPDDWFFGRKFERCLGLFDGDVMLQISADAACDDWSQVANGCRAAFDEFPVLGVWGPDVDGVYWDLAMTKLGRVNESSAYAVTLIDSVVWAMSRGVAERFINVDFACNNLGWGIDRLAALFCHISARLVMRELGIRVHHPLGSGYDHVEARAQQEAFLRQAVAVEKVHDVLMEAFHEQRHRARQPAGNTSTGSTGLALSSGVGA